MVATDKLFAGSIPEIYERFLVPLIFESSTIVSGDLFSTATLSISSNASGSLVAVIVGIPALIMPAFSRAISRVVPPSHV